MTNILEPKPAVFLASKKERELIAKIVARAKHEWPKLDTMCLHMDLVATNANGNPMDFQKLLDAPRLDFVHDITGINRHIDRMTGGLKDCFSPRCSKPLTGSVTKYLSKIGRKGGSVTSPAKAKAVRENGKLGGWKKGRKRKGTK
jgi:hypothetical protein